MFRKSKTHARTHKVTEKCQAIGCPHTDTLDKSAMSASSPSWHKVGRKTPQTCLLPEGHGTEPRRAAPAHPPLHVSVASGTRQQIYISLISGTPTHVWPATGLGGNPEKGKPYQPYRTIALEICGVPALPLQHHKQIWETIRGCSIPAC